MRSPSLLAPLLVVALSHCGGAPKAAAPSAASEPSPKPKATKLGSRLFPDLPEDYGKVVEEPGARRILAAGLRILERADGGIERATERFPVGQVVSVTLPDRLGGGFLFLAQDAGDTAIWRTERWLGELEPLGTLTGGVDTQNPAVVGFDRVYIRFRSGNRLIALDPRTGEPLPLGPLPEAQAYGELVFVDGWRGVVEADLRGPMVTFDAGATWRPLGVSNRVLRVDAAEGDPQLLLQGGERVRIHADGSITHHGAFKKQDAGEAPEPAPPVESKRGQLRKAVERGFVDGNTAIFAEEGALVRVSLKDGSEQERHEDAYDRPEADCSAIRFGAGYGFLCGEIEGETTVYRMTAAMSLVPVLELDEPRFVSPSGNGWLVVRGGCSNAADDVGARPYCIVRPDGGTSEVRVRGDLGAERVVALSDGRVVVLVPPRPGAEGQISIIDGKTADHRVLSLPEEPRSLADDVRRGLWLEGFEQRGPSTIGGWVEAGGPMVGLEIDLDGKVEAGEIIDTGEIALVSGRRALFVERDGEALESTDGGFSYRELFIPPIDLVPEDMPDTRGCGPVGCALPGWLRVGWGEDRVADDLREPELPEGIYFDRTKPKAAMRLDCSTPVAGPEPAPYSAAPHVDHGFHGSTVIAPPLDPFRETPAPALGESQLGMDNGAAFDLVSVHVYAWGNRGSDWSRAGSWQARFDDRFDPGGGVRSSATTRSPWSSESVAAEAIGAGFMGHNRTWSGEMDPSGDAALLSGCGSDGCNLYAVASGQPVVQLAMENGRRTLPLPLSRSAVKIGDRWYYLALDGTPDQIALWTAELGVARRIRVYHRPERGRFGVAAPVTLVRRALGAELGLLVPRHPDLDQPPRLLVFPIDVTTGELGGAMELPNDGRDVGACAKGQDGWVVVQSLDRPAPTIRVPGYANFDTLEGRFRMDPASVCLDAVAADLEIDYDAPKGTARSSAPIPLAATEVDSGQRWGFSCKLE